jgi:diacylglycerol O-acyltransferase / wax synthase
MSLEQHDPGADEGCMKPVPLGDEDRAILALESDVVAGHTCKVVRLHAGGLDLDALRHAIAARLARAPALRRRLGGSEDVPAWVEATDFQLANHVVATGAPAPLDDLALRTEVARLFGERLDRSRPLWRLDVARLADGGSALIWRIHHALADGTAAMRLANVLLWDEAPAAPPPARSAHDEPVRAPAPRPTELAGFLRRELPLTARRSPFDGRIGHAREVAFATVPLQALHTAAKRCDGASLNDAVLTIVAGALQRWLDSHHAGLGSVRVKVPVSLHRPGDDDANRDSSFTLPLPLGEPDPAARLRAVHAATSGRKRAHDAETLETVLRDLGRVSPGLRAIAERLDDSPRGFALNVSNVPGPCDAVSVLGAPVASLHSIAEIGERHALRVAVVSLADQLGFGLCADPGVVPDLQALALGLEDDAAALIAATPRHHRLPER